MSKITDFGLKRNLKNLENHSKSDMKIIIFLDRSLGATKKCNMKNFDDPLQNNLGTLSQNTGLKDFFEKYVLILINTGST